MSARSLNWLKFGGLVALAFALGLLFAGLLDLTNRGAAQEQGRQTSAIAPVPAPSIPAARPLQDLSEAFAAVAEHVKPSVVYIRSQRTEHATQQRIPPGMERFFSPRFRQQPEIEQGSGSGFIISADGYILTNNHVVEGAEQVTVRLLDRREFKAKVVGTDPKTDVALLKVDGRTDFPYVSFTSTEPRVGDWVIAVGNPYGLGGTVTAGIVSARGRDIGSGPYDDFIQIDAPVNKGNSGGPAFDENGNVIGVTTAIYSPSEGSIGIGFAIPADTVKAVVAQLRDHGSVTRGWIGVHIQTVTQDIADSLGLKEAKGALVAEPQSGSPAAKAGLVAGDLIQSVNGQEVKDSRDLAKKIAAIKPGATITLGILHNGSPKSV